MKAAKALKEKGDTPEALLQSIKENEKAVAEAEKEVAAWKAIAGEKARREEAAKAEAERIATEKAEAERKAAEERERAEKEERDRIEAELDAQKADEEARLEAERKAEEERIAKQKTEEEVGNPKIDKQGNPIDAEGRLITEKVEDISDLSDDDFNNPKRSVELPKIPKNIDSALGANGKPVIIKKNIFERNKNAHSDLTAEQSREILKTALYSADLYAKNQKSKRPFNWVIIKTKDHDGKNKLVLLEVNDNKDNVEIVHWHYLDDRGLEKIKKQAEREGGQLLILPSEKEEAGALSSRTSDLPADKGSEKPEKKQENQSVFDKAKEIADKEEKKRKAEADKPKQKPLTEAERKDAEEVAGALGYRVEWVDTMEENGTIDADKKVIRIAKDAENPLVQVLGHEVAHGVRRMIGGKFRVLQKAAMEVVGEKEWNERIEKKRELNAYAEGKLAEEVTCDIVGEALNNKDALKRLAESLRGEKGILARLRDAVARMVEYFKNRGDKEGVRRMKAADKLLAEFESALKEDVASGQANPEDVDRSVRESEDEPENKRRKDFAERFGVDESYVSDYANGMAQKSTGKAARAKRSMERQIYLADDGKTSKLSDIAKSLKQFRAALKEAFGDLDALIDEYRKLFEEERNMMEAARKKAEEEAAARKRHLDELSLLTDGQIDSRYAEALEKGDETEAREMLDEVARRKGYGDENNEYRMQHRAPSNPGYESDEARRNDIENGPDVNLEDIALGYNRQPDDYFTNPRGYGNDTPHGRESTDAVANALSSIRQGGRDVTVKVYRAVPTMMKEGKLRNGDWVTLSRRYAEMHGNHTLNGKYRIMEDEVPAKDIWWDGNDVNEFGYDNGEDYKYKNVKNNRKSDDLVTRDDKGNVIPPSKRFNQRKADERYSRRESKALTAEERELRDNLVERMRKGGLDVVTDSEEMQRVIDTENERTRMMGAGSVREHRVYHGSGADFDAFDHSHMGEGEGAQAYGWGTYVTEVEGIGRTYAVQNSKYAREYPVYNGDSHGLSEGRVNEILEFFLDGVSNEPYILRAWDDAMQWYSSRKDDDYAQSLVRDASLLNPSDISIAGSKTRNLYTVEIPDDNGSNYLDWDAPLPKGTIPRINEYLREKYGEDETVSARTCKGLYHQLERILGGDKKASQALAELGYTGIKYPADYRRGGRKDGAKNYVIFNENDAKITAHTRFLRTAGGEVYGLVKDGRIYLDPKVATSETAVHEYTHLWGDMLRRKDSEQWSRTVKELKNSVLWEEVKELYPELKTDDEIADEVLSTFSGRRGAERLREEARRVADGEGGVFTKAKAIEALEKVKETIARFWEGVARMFGINRYRSAEELADMAMRDLINGVKPTSRTFTFDNFYKDTKAVFEGTERPKGKPDYTSYSGSEYWYGEDKGGKYVVRGSDHWSGEFKVKDGERTNVGRNHYSEITEDGMLPIGAQGSLKFGWEKGLSKPVGSGISAAIDRRGSGDSNNIASCYWYIDNAKGKDNKGFTYGKAYLSEFEDKERRRDIPGDDWRDIQGLEGGTRAMRSEAAATPLKGDEALTALDSIFGENEGSAIPPKISSFAKFKNLFKKPVRTFLGELVQVKDEVWNKILRNNRQDITGTVLPTIENADFAIRDTDGSTLYVKRFKGDGQERMYNVVVVNKHGEVEDYISSVHIKRDNNLRNKIKKGAELFLPNARTTDGTISRNNSTPGAKVANYSETAKPRFSRKPGESIFDYASRVSDSVDRSVRERVSARDEYEKKVKSKGFQTKEALQNSMLGLQEFMFAIDHASGNKRYIEDIPDFENPILGENRLSSVNKEEMHQVARTQFKPLMSAVAKLSGNGKESGELYDYMFAKHGLERDAVMRQREAQKEFDKYKKANPKGTKTIGDFVASLEGKDYAGLTAVRIQHMEFVIQTDETEFSSEIFLWRESQRHQNPNLGDADCESSADGDAEGIETTMELLRTGYYGQDNTDVPRRFLQSVQQPRKGMGYHSFQGFRCTF